MDKIVRGLVLSMQEKTINFGLASCRGKILLVKISGGRTSRIVVADMDELEKTNSSLVGKHVEMIVRKDKSGERPKLEAKGITIL